jgi:hypothetical protein
MKITCALTNKVIEPGKSAIAADGLTYDRKVILSYVRKNGKSPITYEPLKISDIVFENNIESENVEGEISLNLVRNELNDLLELCKQEGNFEKFPSDLNVVLIPSSENNNYFKCDIEDSTDNTKELSDRIIKSIKFNTSHMYFMLREIKGIFTANICGNENLKIHGSQKMMNKLNDVLSTNGRVRIEKYSSFTKQYLVKKWLDEIFVDEIMSKSLRVIMNLEDNKSIDQKNINYSFDHLNDEQASVFSEKNFKYLEIVEGPPGTGKTSVISTTLDFIDKINFNSDSNKHYTIVISEKNRGVDAVSERLSPYQYDQVLSFGSENMGVSTIPYLVENKLQFHPIIQEEYRKINVLYEQCNQKIRKLRRLLYNNLPRSVLNTFNWTNVDYILFHLRRININKNYKTKKIYGVIEELQLLKLEIRKIEESYQDVLSLAKEKYKEKCNIILVTFGSLHQVSTFLKETKNNKDYSFTFVIDEASTLLSWQGFYLEHFVNEVGGSMKNMILLGDSKQCSPYFPDHNNPNIEKGSFIDLAKSKCCPINLKKTYRIPKQIMNIMNKLYYKNSLILGHNRDCYKAVSWIHSENKNNTETDLELNEYQAKLVIKIIIKYVPIDKKTMILTPYKKQCDLLTSLCVESGLQNVSVMTIDSSQGHESDIVCISLVKNQPTSFLTNKS